MSEVDKGKEMDISSIMKEEVKTETHHCFQDIILSKQTTLDTPDLRDHIEMDKDENMA